jgi:hypothetical protein
MVTISRSTLSLMAIGLVLSLSACEKDAVIAPKDRGVCYQIGFPKDQPPKFNVVKSDVEALEYCAAHLDNLRITFARQGAPRREVIGAYQGNFLFVDGRGVKFAQRFNGQRFVLLVKAPDGRLVMPGTIVQEEPTDFSDVQTLPDNLPKKQ